MNEAEVMTWPIERQKEAFDIVIFNRVLDELVLVGALNKVKKDGTPVPKEDTLEDLGFTLESERAFIRILGRRRAALVYGRQEGIRSAISTVDYVLTTDYVSYYKKLIQEQADTPDKSAK